MDDVNRRLMDGRVRSTRVVKRVSMVSTARSNSVKLRFNSLMLREERECVRARV